MSGVGVEVKYIMLAAATAARLASVAGSQRNFNTLSSDVVCWLDVLL